jgi:hypothetical protein
MCDPRIRMRPKTRPRKKPLRLSLDARNTGAAVYDQDAETPRAVRLGVCARRNSAPLDSVGPPNEPLGGGILVPSGGFARGRRHSVVASLRITSEKDRLGSRR